MKITLFGATGTVGKYIIDLGLAKGHQIRAFGRNVYEKLSTERTGLELFKGYIFQEDDVKAALEGADAVLSVLGGGIDGNDKTRSLGMKTIVSAMEKTSPGRVVAVGGTGLLNVDEDTYIFETPGFPAMFQAVTQEHYKAFQALANSLLEWTLVCPPMIDDASYTGNYLTEADYSVGGTGHINAGDLADFMLKELINNNYIRHRVSISN